MNKLWWIIVIIILIIGGYYLWGGSATPANTPAPANNQPATNAPTATSGESLKDLIASGLTQQCTFKQLGDGLTNEGTVYVGNGQMRGDFSSVSNGQTIKAHMIVKGQDTYTWLDGLNLGFKATVNPTSNNGNQANGIDVNQKLDYHCSPWTVENARFTLPTSITFSATPATQ